MRATHFLYRAVTGQSVPSGDDLCLLCGISCGPGTVPVKEVIRDTFTNHGMCRAPHSRAVCPACGHYFNHRWLPAGFKKPAEYRLLSIRILTDRMEMWPRERMRPNLETMLRDGCPECVLVVSLSKKKHLLPFAPVNPPSRSFAVQVEEETVQLSAGAWFPLAQAFDALLALDIPKGAILAGNYHHAGLRKAPLAEVLRWDAAIAPWRPSGLLTLLSYVTLLEEKSDAGDIVADAG